MHFSLANTLLNSPIPTPTGPGSNSNCGAYYCVEANDDCSKIGVKFGISLSDLYENVPPSWVFSVTDILLTF